MLTDAGQAMIELQPDLIALTGGNVLSLNPGGSHVSIERETTERALLTYARDAKCPVLSVCRGFQFLNAFLGCGVSLVEGHVANSNHTPIQKLIVNSYHNFGIADENLSRSLQSFFVDENGFIEAAQHKTLPWLGMMWHPERATPDPQSFSWLHAALHKICF